MRIVHVSSSDNKGGAARSAYRLHTCLRNEGIDSTMFVKRKFTNDESVIEFEHKPVNTLKKITFQFRRRWETRGMGYLLTQDSYYEGFASPFTPSGISSYNQMPKGDIVNLHWIAGFWDFRILPKLVNNYKGVVWRPSDMNPFTGGCFYDNNCQRFIENCGYCPCLASDDRNDLSSVYLKVKRKILNKLPANFLYIVAQSNWIKNQIQQNSILSKFPVFVIPNGIDTSVFQEVNKLEARKRLGIREKNYVLLFICQSLSNPRKGGKEFVEVVMKVAKMTKKPITILAVGSDTLPNISGVNIVNLSQVSSNEKLVQCYSAADIYVITSLQDNLPNTVLESMACGTPVVGFAVGGIIDMIENGDNGFLVERNNINQLASLICKLLEHEKLRLEMGKLSRVKVSNNFEIKSQTLHYINLYRKILNV